jgi:putative phosphoesterase
VRVAVIADTHLPRGARRLPDRCVEEIKAADLVLHAGDIATVGALAELEALGPPVRAVLGNVDEPALAERGVPVERVVEAAGATIAMLHDAGPAAGRLGRLRLRFPAADVVVFGHSHIPLHEQDADGFQIFNPGSPTDRRRQPRHTMGVAEVAGGRVRLRHVALD